MPAYRSADEGEIRAAVVDKLRIIRPSARIIHEINCAVFGSNRIDLIAVSEAEIISVEIKSKKDKLDRLPAQIKSMKKMSHHVIAALHEKFLVERETNEWSAYSIRDGKHYGLFEPKECEMVNTWVYPQRRRRDGWDKFVEWGSPDQAMMISNIESLHMLWVSELKELCFELGLSAGKRPTLSSMTSLIKWNATGADITKGVCRILRRRECVEADPPIASSHSSLASPSRPGLL